VVANIDLTKVDSESRKSWIMSRHKI